MPEHQHAHHTHEQTPPKNRRWLRIIAAGSVVIGVAQSLVGGAALKVDAAHNVFGDSLAYGLKDAASTQHHELKASQVRRRLKLAGFVLCLSSLFGVAEAAHDVVNDHQHQASSTEIGLAAVSMAYGALSAKKLHAVGTDLAHEHGVRHGRSDVLSSGAVLISAFCASQGVPYADAIGAATAASITIGFNYPTATRLEHEVGHADAHHQEAHP